MALLTTTQWMAVFEKNPHPKSQELYQRMLMARVRGVEKISSGTWAEGHPANEEEFFDGMIQFCKAMEIVDDECRTWWGRVKQRLSNQRALRIMDGRNPQINVREFVKALRG